MMIDLITQLVLILILFGYITLLGPILDDDALFIDCDPVLHIIFELIDHKLGKIAKVFDNLAR